MRNVLYDFLLMSFIAVGDKLIEINGQTQIAEFSLESIISQIAGPEGSQVSFLIDELCSEFQFQL